MTTRGDLEKLKAAAGAGFDWQEPVRMPGGEDRILSLGKRTISLPA